MIVERFAFNSLLGKLRQQHDDHHQHELDCTALCCAKNGQCAVVAHLVGDESESERLRDLGNLELFMENVGLRFSRMVLFACANSV